MDGGRKKGWQARDTGPKADRLRIAGEGLAARLPGLSAAWRGKPGPLSPAEISSLGRDLLRLQRGLTGGRELAGAGYMEDRGLLGAYLMYYWPVSYLQVSAALAFLDLPAGRRLRVLDLGSGPGPAAAACADAGATELLLADSSPRALALASNLLSASGPSPHTRVLDLEAGNLAEGDPAEGKYDLVIASHLLNELWKGQPDRIERRRRLAEAALDCLAPGGILLLLEPSLLSTSRDLLALRDALAAAGHPILGPCLRQGPCPALAAGEGQTCHAELPWSPPEPVAALAREAGLDRESVKMTWFAVAKADGTVPATSSGSLVVSDAMLNKAGRLRYMLCDEKGRYALSARRDDPKAEALGFFGLRRYDRIEIVGAERRGTENPSPSPNPGPGQGPSPLGLVEGSSLRLLSRVVLPEAGDGKATSQQRGRRG